MKKLFVLFALLVLLSTYVASECNAGPPIIGTLGDIKQEFRRSVEYGLSNVAIIEEKNDEIVSVDYGNVVQDYVSGKAGINSEVSKGKNNNNVFISTPAINFFSKGNIVIVGPPIQSCSHSFRGVFDSSGKLRTGLFGSYGKYKYGGTLIDVSPGETLDCEGLSCNVKADFDINGEKFTLMPGDSYISKGNSVNTVTLIEAHDFGFNENNNGSGTYAVFLMNFKDRLEGEYVPQNSLQNSPKQSNKNSKSSVKIEDRIRWESSKGVIIIESGEKTESEEDTKPDIAQEERKDESPSVYFAVLKWVQWFSFFFPGEK